MIPYQTTNFINHYLSEKFVKKIEKLVNSFDITDNNERADILTEMFEEKGFSPGGTGTNRICFIPDDNMDIIFKVSLDERGVDDNNSEYELSKALYPDVTLTYENIGFISVAEKVEVMTSDTFNNNIEEIKRILYRLSNDYLLDDVGPTTFFNWGLRGVKPVVLDFAYLVSSEFVDFRCKHPDCYGYISYTDDLKELECSECKAKYTVSQLRATIDPDDVLMSRINTKIPENRVIGNVFDRLHIYDSINVVQINGEISRSHDDDDDFELGEELTDLKMYGFDK